MLNKILAQASSYSLPDSERPWASQQWRMDTREGFSQTNTSSVYWGLQGKQITLEDSGTYHLHSCIDCILRVIQKCFIYFLPSRLSKGQHDAGEELNFNEDQRLILNADHGDTAYWQFGSQCHIFFFFLYSFSILTASCSGSLPLISHVPALGLTSLILNGPTCLESTPDGFLQWKGVRRMWGHCLEYIPSS